MEITVEMSGKTPRSYGGRTKWGVHPVGAPKDYWIDIYYPERPKVGQVFNIGAVKEEKSKDGAKIFREAEIIGTSSPEARITIPDGKGNGNAWPAPETPKANQPPPPPSNGPMFPPKPKIKWAEWCEIAKAANELAIRIEPASEDAYARMKFVNTTLMEYAKGNLELPTEAGPVMREPGDDQDEAYRNADEVIPWERRTA